MVFPPDQSTNIDMEPVFNWDDLTNVNAYLFELASDENFSDILESVEVSDNSYTPLADLEELTTYYWRVRAESKCGIRSSLEYSFETTMTSSIIEISGNEINIFPNPVDEYINLIIGQGLSNELHVPLVSLDGKIVRHKQLSKGRTHFRIDVLNITPGIYFLQFIKGDQQVVEKITVY